MKIYCSVTSIIQNQSRLFKVLKSILNQSLKPDKIYIFLSENHWKFKHIDGKEFLRVSGFYNKNINFELSNFIDNNSLFEIRWVENTGPYRKLLPLLKEKKDEDCVIITIDDDHIYNQDLIKNFIKKFDKFQCSVSNIGFTLFDSLEHYSNFDYSKQRNYLKINKFLYNFAVGAGGVLYHPKFLPKETFDDSYKNLCPTADDVWFNIMRIKNNIDLFVSDDIWSDKNICNRQTSLFFKFNKINNLNGRMISDLIEKYIQPGRIA